MGKIVLKLYEGALKKKTRTLIGWLFPCTWITGVVCVLSPPLGVMEDLWAGQMEGACRTGAVRQVHIYISLAGSWNDWMTITVIMKPINDSCQWERLFLRISEYFHPCFSFPSNFNLRRCQVCNAKPFLQEAGGWRLRCQTGSLLPRTWWWAV